jgi:predicted cytidylate kinase
VREHRDNLARRTIAISGDLGSGKSSVAKGLAELLGLQILSTGELQRSIARRRKLSLLELNQIAEQDTAIDRQVDDELRDLAAEGRPVIVDSRMAWWFIPDAVSVHLVVSPKVGAQRVLQRQNASEGAVERYASASDALNGLSKRAESERARFRALYEVDIARLRNYHVVVDTTSATVGQVATDILDIFYGMPDSGSRPKMLSVSPANVYPTQSSRDMASFDPRDADRIGNEESLRANPISIGYSQPDFFVIDGHKRLASAIILGANRIFGHLVAENSEDVIGGITADRYFRDSSTHRELGDWQHLTGICLTDPSHLRQM